MARILFTLDEPTGTGTIAGLQVRVLEMSGALARAGHDVVVATPNELASVGSVDVWITHPRMVAPLADAVATRALVVDGYESPFGSFLAHAAALLPRIGERAITDYRATAVDHLTAIAAADRVLCANAAQRVSYLTILSMLGRIGPRTPDADVVLLVSSGASPDPPERPLDGTPHAPVLLWYGGCYPWFDVETYLAALPAIATRVPDVRLRFAGIDGVGDPDALPRARRIRDTAAAPALAARTEIVPWMPYAERGELYASADVGVCTYGDHLETQLSMRTRVIDMIWGGLPLVVSAGDEMSRVVERHALGRTVRPGDPTALAGAVTELLADAASRRAASARARTLALGELSWDRQVAPLARWCADVATGVAVPEWRPSDDALVQLNDGPVRDLADAFRHLAWRAGNAWRLGRRDGVGSVWRRVWP